MDNRQPWNRTGPVPGYFSSRSFRTADPATAPPKETPQTTPQQTTQHTINQDTDNSKEKPDISRQMDWLRGMSREERLESKRRMLQENFSWEGFQVVRREYISHVYDPAMTVRDTSITFNNACISKLEEATYIHFMINIDKKLMVIRAVEEGVKDAVRWCTVRDDKRKSRQITCRPLTGRLYEILGWDPVYRYKMQGMKIDYKGVDMFAFDLTEVERFLPQRRDPQTGKVTVPKGELPAEWGDSLGVSVEEHDNPEPIDLEEGFVGAQEIEGKKVNVEENNISAKEDKTV